MRNRHIQVRVVKDPDTPDGDTDTTLIADQMYIINETAKSVGKVVAGLMVLRTTLAFAHNAAIFDSSGWTSCARPSVMSPAIRSGVSGGISPGVAGRGVVSSSG